MRSFLLILCLFLAASTCNSEKDTLVPWKTSACPFPIYLHSTLKNEKHNDSLWKAAMYFHREVGGPNGYGPMFMPASAINPARKITLIQVRDPLLTERFVGGICSDIINKKRFAVSHFKYRSKSGSLQGGTIIFCSNLTKHLTRLGRSGNIEMYFRHELLHVLLGSGHLVKGCSLLCKVPSRTYMSYRERTAIEQLYKPCKRREI